MKTIRCLNDLAPYGIVPLTGEACGLMLRILCDVTETGRKILAKAFGIPAFALAEPWNRGTPANPHVGSIMLTTELVPFLGIFALLESGSPEVWLLKDGSLIAPEATDSPEQIAANRHLIGDHLARVLAYRGTAGDRNVHVMSGRTE